MGTGVEGLGVAGRRHRRRVTPSWLVALCAAVLLTLGALSVVPASADPPPSPTLTLTPGAVTVPAGSSLGLTVTLDNPGPDPTTLVGLSVLVPGVGFTPVTGSVTGVTVADPVVTAGGDGDLWAWGEGVGSWPAGSVSLGPGETATLHLEARVPAAPGEVRLAAEAVTGTGTISADPVTITITNAPPGVDAGGGYAGGEGTAIAVAGSASDPDGDAVTVAWSVAPRSGVAYGTTCAVADPTALATTLACSDEGIFTVTLTVADPFHPPVTASAVLVVSNLPPTVSISDPDEGARLLQGDPLTITAAYSDPGAGDAHTYDVDFCDGYSTLGAAHSGSIVVTHVVAAPQTCPVTVWVTDDSGAYAESTVTVTVAPRPVTISGTGSILLDGRRATLKTAVSRDLAGRLSGTTRITRGVHAFAATTIGRLTAVGRQATWAGSGRWDGRPGFRYLVTVVDNPPGVADRVRLQVTGPSGSIVLSGAGATLPGGALALVWR